MGNLTARKKQHKGRRDMGIAVGTISVSNCYIFENLIITSSCVETGSDTNKQVDEEMNYKFLCGLSSISI